MGTIVVAIPVRNSAATLRPTLESLLAQSYRDLRIVIVDNASTDDSALIAKDFASRDKRVELKSFTELVPAEDNFNRCLREATGEFIAVVHADDVYERNMIEEQAAFLNRHPECGVVFTHAKIIDVEGNLKGERFLPPELSQANAVLSANDLMSLVVRYGNFITCPSALMRSRLFADELKGWNGRDFGSSADLDLWLRASRKAPVGFISQALMRYRESVYSFTVQMQKVRTFRHPMLKAIEAHLDLVQGDPASQWFFHFLEAKDAAFVSLNKMKKGESVETERTRLSFGEYVRALSQVGFHRHFAIRMAAIGIFERLFKIGFLRPLVSGFLARIRT